MSTAATARRFASARTPAVVGLDVDDAAVVVRGSGRIELYTATRLPVGEAATTWLALVGFGLAARLAESDVPPPVRRRAHDLVVRALTLLRDVGEASTRARS